MKKKTLSPFVLRIMKRIFSRQDFVDISSYLEDLHNNDTGGRSRLPAGGFLFREIIKSIPGFVLNFLYWKGTMFKNYLKMTLRNIRMHKVYSLINIAGLVIGITCSILILLYVRYELSYDRYHEDAKDIYRVVFNVPDRKIQMNASTFGAMAPALKQASLMGVMVHTAWGQ